MKQVLLSLPTFGFAVATRAALAAGVALLVANRLTPARPRAIGTTLVSIGHRASLAAHHQRRLQWEQTGLAPVA